MLRLRRLRKRLINDWAWRNRLIINFNNHERSASTHLCFETGAVKQRFQRLRWGGGFRNAVRVNSSDLAGSEDKIQSRLIGETAQPGI